MIITRDYIKQLNRKEQSVELKKIEIIRLRTLIKDLKRFEEQLAEEILNLVHLEEELRIFKEE